MDSLQPSACLFGLPNELLLLVGQNLVNQADLYSLYLTNRLFSNLLAPQLFSFAVKTRGNKTALQWAASRGHARLAKVLLQTGFGNDFTPTNTSTSQDPNTPLKLAITFGSVALVKVFLEHGVDIEARDSFGNTLIHTAIIAIMQISRIKNPSQADRQRARELLRVLDLLLHSGLNPSLFNMYGNPPLHLATSFSNHTETAAMEMLLQYGAQVNLTSPDGASALHHSAWCGMANCVKLLIRYGADIHVKDEKGNTALDWAYQKGHSHIVELLQEYGRSV